MLSTATQESEEWQWRVPEGKSLPFLQSQSYKLFLLQLLKQVRKIKFAE